MTLVSSFENGRNEKNDVLCMGSHLRWVSLHSVATHSPISNLRKGPYFVKKNPSVIWMHKVLVNVP